MALQHNKMSAAFGAGLVALVALGGASSPALAQTVLSPLPADPATIRLQERVEQIEQQLRETTGEIERLRFDLSKAQQDLARANKTLDDVLAGQGGVALGGQPLSGPIAAPGQVPAGFGAAPTSPPPAAGAVQRPAAADAEANYKGAQSLLLSGDYPAAERAFRAFVKDYPNAAQISEARYWLGQTLLAQGSNSEAAKQFLDVVKLHGKSQRAPDAFARLGLALRGMGNVREACLTFRDLPQRFPAASQSIKDLAAREAKAAACPA